MFSISQYAVGGLVVALIVLKLWTGIIIGNLEDNVAELTVEVTTLTVNNVALKSSITEQNKAIKALSVDVGLKEEELVEWQNKPAKIRYKTIYKEIPEYVDMRKETCENTKSIIDVARNYNFNSTP